MIFRFQTNHQPVNIVIKCRMNGISIKNSYYHNYPFIQYQSILSHSIQKWSKQMNSNSIQYLEQTNCPSHRAGYQNWRDLMDNQQESGFLFSDTHHCASSKHGNHTNHCNSNEEDCVSWEFRNLIHPEYSHGGEDHSTQSNQFMNVKKKPVVRLSCPADPVPKTHCEDKQVSWSEKTSSNAHCKLLNEGTI